MVRASLLTAHAVSSFEIKRQTRLHPHTHTLCVYIAFSFAIAQLSRLLSSLFAWLERPCPLASPSLCLWYCCTLGDPVVRVAPPSLIARVDCRVAHPHCDTDNGRSHYGGGCGSRNVSQAGVEEGLRGCVACVCLCDFFPLLRAQLCVCFSTSQRVVPHCLLSASVSCDCTADTNEEERSIQLCAHSHPHPHTQSLCVILRTGLHGERFFFSLFSSSREGHVGLGRKKGV